MTAIDWTMVALFFAVLVGIPLAAARKGASSSKEFFLSGQSMPWWLLGISMVAATTSTNSSNLFTEIIRSKGMGGNWAWWAFLLTGLLTVFVYSKLWRRSGVTTDIGFYELRYSGKPAAFLRCFRTLYLGVFFNLIVMAFVTLGAVKIGVVVFGVPAWVILVVAAAASVIYAAFGGLRGSYRCTEEGTTYYQYTTMSVENMEETVMPVALVRLANRLEAEGFTAVPQRRHQTIMEAKDGMNPEVAYDAITRDRPQEPQMRFTDAAVRCGVGEKGFHGALLTDPFGPMQRVCFLLTDAELPPDPVVQPHLCDRCGACAKGCPGHAVDAATGAVDDWRCAVYYNGANGQKNPFMPPDAFKDFPDRLAIIAGEAEISPEKARKILDQIYFYPPAQHSYNCSICGRACDVACYCHLEEKGVLTKKFRKPFRTRPEWKFPLSDFETRA